MLLLYMFRVFGFRKNWLGLWWLRATGSKELLNSTEFLKINFRQSRNFLELISGSLAFLSNFFIGFTRADSFEQILPCNKLACSRVLLSLRNLGLLRLLIINRIFLCLDRWSWSLRSEWIEWPTLTKCRPVFTLKRRPFFLFHGVSHPRKRHSYFFVRNWLWKISKTKATFLYLVFLELLLFFLYTKIMRKTIVIYPHLIKVIGVANVK